MRLLAPAVALLLAMAPVAASAQQDSARSPAPPKTADAKPAHTVTHHTATIGGQRVDYEATLGSIILRDDEGNPTAEVWYTAYTRTGAGDGARRPVTFAYNGGPGSSSVWLHMGALGPRRIATADTVHAPPPPYTLVDNPYSIVDVTDLVMIDPVGTGFSRPLGKATGKDFWGVDQDARSLGQFVTRWLSENGRWNSPRYLLGESYGTTRSAALGAYLQDRENVDLNGIILLSSVLEFSTISFNPGNDLPYMLYLPSYAAVAWYHDALPDRPAELEPFLREVQQFALGDYARALLAGGRLEDAERSSILDRLHRYTGLSRDYLDRADMRVLAPEFEQELMREHGLTVGRLDARFTGPTLDPMSQFASYDPQSSAVSSAYTSAINSYLRQELGYKGDRPYTISGNVNPWDWTHGRSFGWPGYTNVAQDLAQTMKENPTLHVMLNSGYYDLATPYFAADYTMDHLDIPAQLRSNLETKYYGAGHMMYLYEPSLAKLKENIADFIRKTSAVRPAASGTH